MKSSKLSIIILFTIAIIGTLLLSIFLLKDGDDHPSNLNNESNEEANPEIEKEDNYEIEHSAYPGVDIRTEIKDQSSYHLAIHYPEFNDDALNERVNEYIFQAKEDFLSEVEKNEEHLQKFSASLYISFDIYSFSKDMYSIVLNRESNLAGANLEQSSKVLLVDLVNNQFIQQADILIDSEVNRDKIYQLLLKEFRVIEKYRHFLFEDYLKEWVYAESNQFTNMFLTEDSLIFKFDKYVVTAGVAGSPQISIPFNQASDLIADEWKKIIKLEQEEETPVEEPEETIDENDEEAAENNNEAEHIEGNQSVNKKKVALTFDDGPHPVNTLAILQLLEEYDAKATFFMLGANVDFYPGIAKKVAEAGHELGNHTWTHRDMTTLAKEEIKGEVSKTNDVIQTATGEKANLFRPPYGSINDQVREILDLPAVLWTIDTMDWQSHDPQQVLSIVKTNVTDGSIILLHDIHDRTVEATKLVLKFLQAEGYEFVTVSELKGY